MYSQCLYYALDKWHEEGGYVLLARSAHWCIPHVLHMSNKGEITHFVPPANLKEPWHSLFGFEGIIRRDDAQYRAPMGKICMFIGTMILLVLGCNWVINRFLWSKTRC